MTFIEPISHAEWVEHFAAEALERQAAVATFDPDVEAFPYQVARGDFLTPDAKFRGAIEHVLNNSKAKDATHSEPSGDDLSLMRGQNASQHRGRN